MTPHRLRRLQPILWLGAAAALLSVSGCAAWRIGQAAELARQSEPLQQTPPQPALRLLIVGDSTAVGTGASSGAASLAGLIAQGHPRLWIDNRARDGALFADVQAQLESAASAGHFDLVLVQAGGNDVIRMRSLDDMRQDIDRVTALARQRADLVLWMPAGNVGNAPFFFVPVSWLMTSRARQMHALVQDAAARHGAVYVKLFQERADDPFVQQPGLHARDGLHPSDAGYRVWWAELDAQAAMAQRLSAARAP